ncbi:hypothetical protein OG555_14695 [Kribbella sp. NBC_01484]|uniref:hypothetical protein n=1 Tax=Kribbella sp. NBC_01484 TaxID=2903579 RepID=UPI002E32671D|nr:hypothetical protein [Kribbella sp. NBC_01484]
MSNSTPEIPGYQFDQRLLQHPLAELWHGRSFTGMEIVALVLSEAGARDATVRDRLVRAGRGAALEPARLETPLWAANFSSDRPYAVTQLIPGQSGAERLIDPLDGVIGNDDESLQAVRGQLSQYGARPPTADMTIPSYADHPQATPEPGQAPSAEPQPTTQPQSTIEVAREYKRKIGGWIYAVVAFVVLLVFTITYSIGAAVGSSVKSDQPVDAAPQTPVSPEAYPSPVLLPAIPKITTAPYKRPDGSAGVFGATYAAGTDLQVITTAELPFALGWPRPPQVTFLGESSAVVYRRIVTRSDYSNGGLKNSLDARIALHPCASLAACRADRAAFDKQWAKVYKATAPATAKDARTWLTVQTTPYAVTMTRAYASGGQWWLVGSAVTGAPGEEADVQRIVNDIWRQTS